MTNEEFEQEMTRRSEEALEEWNMPLKRGEWEVEKAEILERISLLQQSVGELALCLTETIKSIMGGDNE